ncbi:MAG: hypothetical protein LQ338_000562 [Usnochroma carphineum]|nr:MAG: hypothetical protein LQ338_000562 [Usnochroma carphineum]
MKESKGDLLTYLAVEEDRHNAVVWLAEEVLKEHMEPSKTSRSRYRQLPTSETPYFSSLLDITYSAEATQEMIDSTGFSDSSLDPLTERANNDAKHECLGEIWRSIGSMVLQAADREPALAKSKSIMTCVHRLLAHMHHVGAIPSTIYNYAPAKDPSVLQRPPTMHYWSLRIMTVISDASWTSLNATTHQDGSVPPGPPSLESSDPLKLPRVEMSSTMPEVEPQIWLDFVLWCCVEGGWITEAAELVYQMWTRRGDGRQYSVIDFSTLSEQHAPKLPWTARIKASIRRSRMRETAGGATFGSYSDRIDFLKPPERTVSSEVVAAIIDGLVSTASSHPAFFGNKYSIVRKYIGVCKIMLERKNLGLGSTSWNAIVLRMFESLSTDPKASQTFVEQIISWSPPFLQEPLATNSGYRFDSTAQTYVADPSAFSIGLLSNRLSDLALLGNLGGALQIFRRLQSIVDTNRRNSLRNFQAMVTPILQQDGEDALVGEGEQQETPGLDMQFSSRTLAPFLDLITDAKEFALGDWLLHSDDVDGCIIPPDMYSDAVLQPSLIRFASAAGDEKLLDRVTQHLETPVPEAVLRSLLHHQIQNMHWDAVREILELLRDGDRLAWDPTDVIALANAVVRAERKHPQILSKDPSVPSPGNLLKALLRGQYNTADDPSRPKDLSQPRMLAQLARIIASVPSQLSGDLARFHRHQYDPLLGSCVVPVNAFNMFLETVVELHGALEGGMLCEKWCSPNNTAGPRGGIGGSDTEQVVKPNVQTFYTILRPLSQASIDADKAQTVLGIQHSSELDRNDMPENEISRDNIRTAPSKFCLSDQERSIANWGIARCLNLGLRWKDMQQDLPGLAAFGDNSNSNPARLL